MKANAHTETALVKLLESFCSAFETKDAEGVMQLFAPDADIVVVTSEESLLRGTDEFKAFLQTYIQGPTIYSWVWARYDVSMAGVVAWLLAEGTETASTQGSEQKYPYRMSIVCEKRDDRWLLMQIHGSSPHHG
jgi:uncharacterized protein (TIGR02246 family)